jgi:hypothetical protein
MSIIQGNTKVSAGGYEIDQSIRFNDNDSPTLQRTFGSTGGNTWTFSCWMKRGNLGKNLGIFYALPSVNSGIGINPSDQIIVADDGAATYNTTAVFRDPSAWYHIVFTGNGTLNKVYVNNVLQTLSGSPNIGSGINKAVNHKIGEGALGASNGPYMDGYFSEIVFVDGTEFSPTDFGETNDDGVWIPKAYEGTYGTNGFYITGEDSADLGADYSGNANDFTSSGLTSDDQVTDTPTDNYATWNVLDKGNVTAADGNLTMTSNVGQLGGIRSTISIPQTGKYYWEMTVNTAGYITQIGLATASKNIAQVNDAAATVSNRGWEFGGWFTTNNAGITYYASDGGGAVGTSWTGVSTPSATDVLMIAYDSDNGSLWFGTNGTWHNSSGTANPATNTDPRFSGLNDGSEWFPFWSSYNTSSPNHTVNFGQSGFAYTPPTGFSALSTANLPTPAIADGSKYFQTTLYTGTGSTLEVNQSENSTFQPDFVWIKKRSGTDRHELEDAVRGASLRLSSDRTDAEDTGGLTSFDADGFTVDGLYGSSGESGFTYAAWQWLAGNGTASNTDGSITSTVSANTTAGFSIVRAASMASGTIGHGLSQAPDMVIGRMQSEVFNWWVWHQGLSGGTYSMKLNDTSAEAAVATVYTAEPTSTVINTGVSWTSGNPAIFYCFHEVEGFSKFGSYTGNGSTDGPFVWCGFRPAFVMFKKTSGTDSWEILDNTRPGYNVTGLGLLSNTTASEATGRNIDILSNGIKQRNANGTTNESGNTYIYMAFAENPFGGDGVAPVPAR